MIADEQPLVSFTIPPAVQSWNDETISQAADAKTMRRRSMRRLSRRVSLVPVLGAGEGLDAVSPVDRAPACFSPPKRRSPMKATPRKVAMSPAKLFTVSMTPIQTIPEEAAMTSATPLRQPRPAEIATPSPMPMPTPARQLAPVGTTTDLLVFDQPTPDVVMEPEHEARRRVSLRNARRTERRRSSAVARLFDFEARAETNRRHSFLPPLSESTKRANRRHTLAVVKTESCELRLDVTSPDTPTAAEGAALPRTPPRRGADNSTVEVDVRTNLDIFGQARGASSPLRDTSLSTSPEADAEPSAANPTPDTIHLENCQLPAADDQGLVAARNLVDSVVAESPGSSRLVPDACGLCIEMPSLLPSPEPQQQPSHGLGAEVGTSTAVLMDSEIPQQETTEMHPPVGAVLSPSKAPSPSATYTASANHISSSTPTVQPEQTAAAEIWVEAGPPESELLHGIRQLPAPSPSLDYNPHADLRQIPAPRPVVQPFDDDDVEDKPGGRREIGEYQGPEGISLPRTTRVDDNIDDTPRSQAITMRATSNMPADIDNPTEVSSAGAGLGALPSAPSTPLPIAKQTEVGSAPPDGKTKVLIGSPIQSSGFTPINSWPNRSPNAVASSLGLDDETIVLGGNDDTIVFGQNDDTITTGLDIEPPPPGEDATLEMVVGTDKIPEGEHLSVHDDSETEMLRNFVTRVKADKTAKAAAAARAKLGSRPKRRSGSSGSTASASGSPVSRKELASSEVLRVPLGEKDHNMSPSPLKKRKASDDADHLSRKAGSRLSKPDLDDTTPPRPKRRRKRMEAETDSVFNPEFQTSQEDAAPGPAAPRRSTRARTTRMALKAPAPGVGAALSSIPVRLPGHLNNGEDALGGPSAALRRNEEKDLAALTRVNTRKNKGDSEYPKMVIARQAASDPSLPEWTVRKKQRAADAAEEAGEMPTGDGAAEDGRTKKTAGKRKAVRWAEVLARAQGEENMPLVAEAASASPTAAYTDVDVTGEFELEAAELVHPPVVAARPATAAETDKPVRADQKKSAPARQTRASRLPPPTPTKAIASAARTAAAAAAAAAADKADAAAATTRASSSTGRMATRRARISGLGMAGNGTPAPKRRATRGTA